MEKTGINSDNITKKQISNLKDVTSLSVANYGNTDMKVTINDVTEIVPAYDTANRFARSFNLSGDGSYSDIDITIDFVGSIGQAVLRYRTIKKC